MQKIAKQFIYIFSLLLILSCEDKKSPTLNKIYIAYQGTEKVGVLNGETGEIIREVDVNISPMGDNPHYIVIDEVNNFWYVTLLESGYVLKYDLITDALISSIKIGNMPALMEIDTENNYLYVSRFMPMMGMETSSTYVHRIHTVTLVKDSINVGASSPHGIALSNDGSTLWVASNQSSHFFKIETSRFNEDGYQPDNYKIDESVQDSYNFNDGTYEPLELVLNSNGQELFISCSDMMINEIRSFSTESGALSNVFELDMTGRQPWHIVIDPVQSILYSANRMGNTVSVVDLNSDEITYILDDTMNMPHGIGISSDGSRVFVTSSAMMGGGASYLHVIDTSTNTVINNFNLGTDVIAAGLAVMQGTCSNCD
jgi:DNA-binding beta-propeller fold protein YncE